jgi:hypothetical protein
MVPHVVPDNPADDLNCPWSLCGNGTCAWFTCPKCRAVYDGKKRWIAPTPRPKKR